MTNDKRNLSDGPFECPKCHALCSLAIEVQATMTISVNDDGAVTDNRVCGDHEFNRSSVARCLDCDHSGVVDEFLMPGPNDASLARLDAGQELCPGCDSYNFTRFSVDNLGDEGYGDADVTCRCWDCGRGWREPGEKECPECKGLDHTTNFHYVEADEHKPEPGWLCDGCFGEHVERKYGDG
jgi:hypothetical protein